MQKPANRFIELLEVRQLLSDEVIVELRRQVAETNANLPPELLARLLVENGHLTKFQASKLITELGSTAASSGITSDKELGLAPTKDVAEAILEDEDNVLAIVDDAVPIVSAESTPSPTPPKTRSRKESSTNTDSSRGPVSSKVKGELADQGDMPAVASTPIAPSGRMDQAPGRRDQAPGRMDQAPGRMDQAPGRRDQANGLGTMPVEIPKVVRPKQAKENPWDSFRILGIGVLLSLVLIVGFFLARWVIRGSADEAIKFADNAYQQRSYEDAANAYRTFAENWPTHGKSSYARVRSVLASVRKDGETAPNPAVGLRTAEQLLPTVRDESALVEQQGDLAGSLVSLAEKFVTRLDATKSTDERKALMSEMDRLMTLIGDPQFFGSMQRTQLSPTLQRIDESRARIRREIQRDDELKLALVEIDHQLDDKDVVKAYETRGRLITRYPLLEANPDLSQRVLRASAIQRDLVKDEPMTIEISTDSAAESELESRILSHLSGAPASDVVGTTVAIQTKGAVYGIDAVSGQVRWRKGVGRGVDSTPIRLSESPESDFLVVRSELGRLWRLEGTTGRVLWRADLNEFINMPLVLDEDVIVTSRTGVVACLDAESGASKWLKRLPQSINIAPGSSASSNLLYQPAEHSNIYVLDRRDGSCKDVFYMGHREGAVQVPPALVLGQLLVAESLNVDAARIRVLSVAGTGLKSAQPPIPVDGNVVHPPSVDGRQVLVQSDLGNSIILDVEPTEASQPVSVTARVPKNLDEPQSIWTAFNRNQVWLAESRLARFDLVVTQGKLNRRWIQHEGDEFVAPLQLFNQTLLHARRPKGNSGLKVSASNADSGNSFWELDLAMPISLLFRSPNKQIDAITSGGHFFTLNNEPVRLQADSNPGEGKPLKQFMNPIWLDQGRAVLLNAANPREYALYSSQGNNRLRVLTVPVGSSKPTCAPVAVGGNVVLGLDNGTLVMFDPETGGLIGAPYQAAPMKPGLLHEWKQPVYLPDTKTVVAASAYGQIVRLSVGESLRALSERTVEYPIIGPLAVVGDKIAAVLSADAGQSLAFFESQSLESIEQQPLDSALVAGPFSVANGLIVQAERGLRFYDTDGKMGWETVVPPSPLVAEPIMTENGQIVIANRQGQLLVLAVDNGKIVGSRELGNIPSAVPLLFGNKLLVGNDDGTVVVLDLPTENTLTGQE